MRVINNYSTSYVGSKNKMNVLKYELCNDYGYNLDGRKTHMTDNDIIKKVCNHRYHETNINKN